MKRGVSIPNVGDPRQLVELGADVEQAGWDGLFLWDHVQIYAGARFDVVDPWMVLAGVALRTERITLGPMVTTPSRRRPWQLAKQIVTLDHLSRGRVVVGVGLGFPVEDEFAAFGEVTDLRERAARTDEALEIIDQVLRGEPVDHTGDSYDVHAQLLPPAVQRPRPRILAAATPTTTPRSTKRRRSRGCSSRHGPAPTGCRASGRRSGSPEPHDHREPSGRVLSGGDTDRRRRADVDIGTIAVLSPPRGRARRPNGHVVDLVVPMQQTHISSSYRPCERPSHYGGARPPEGFPTTRATDRSPLLHPVLDGDPTFAYPGRGSTAREWTHLDP